MNKKQLIVMGSGIFLIVLHRWKYVNHVREFGFDAHTKEGYFINAFIIVLIIVTCISVLSKKKDR